MFLRFLQWLEGGYNDFNPASFNQEFLLVTFQVQERIQQKAPQSDNPLAMMQQRQFDPTKSNVLGAIESA